MYQDQTRVMIAATPIIDKESNLVTVDTLQLSLSLALLSMFLNTAVA